VSGKVLDILVQPNQLVNQGDKLAILDESDYQIAVQQAEQNLEIAGQNVGAQTASIASAQAKLTSAIVERQNTKLQAKRVLEMADKGVVSKSDADKARAALATSGVVSVMLFALVHVFFPEPKSAFSGFAAAPLEKKQRWYAAFRAMIISYPVVCFFFIFQISEALLTMMFIALLSLMITSEKSIKLSAFLVISNGIGGLLAIAAFSILSIVPNIVFYSLFIGLIAILMATKIYTVPEKAPIFATAFSTLLVLVGSTLMSSGDIDSNTLIRIFQLVLIGIYMILASLFLETRNWKFLQNQP
jgi:hypothetical protein